MLNASVYEQPVISNCSSSATATTSIETFPQLMIDLVLFLLVVLASSLTGYRLVLNRPLETNKRPRTRRNSSLHHEHSYQTVPAGVETYK